MSPPNPNTQTKVLVTGFGPFLDITTNPSWEIARQLPSQLTGYSGETIQLIVPLEPTPAAYHKILSEVQRQYEQHAPRLIVHMGLDVDSDPGVFKLERSALRDGYHDIPDIDRRVFTRAENKKVFGRGQDSLATTLDIDTVVESYRGACSSLHLPGASARSKSKSKSKDQQLIDVRLSDDVGTYVCGFQYYVSMLEAQQKIGKKSVVFLHVPKLDYEGDIRVGVTVVEGLIKALVSVLQS